MHAVLFFMLGQRRRRGPNMKNNTGSMQVEYEDTHRVATGENG